MTSTEIAVLGGGGLALTDHAQMTHVGLQLTEGAPEEELLRIAEGLGIVNDAACFAVGDLANFYRLHFPATYRTWIDRPSPTKGLDNKTVKVYAAVSAAFPHEQRARHMATYGGHPGVSFSHFSRVRRYGPEIAEYWLERAATEGWGLGELELQIAAGAIGADDVPDIPRDRTTYRKRGTTFWLGPPEQPDRHLVVVGDSKIPGNFNCIEAMGAKATCIWTDPPYGVDYVSIGRQTKANKNWEAHTRAASDATQEQLEDAAGIMGISNDTIEDLPELLAGAFANLAVVTIPACPFYVAGPSGYNMLTFIQAFLDQGWDYKELLIWRKNVMVFGRSDYHYQHEPIFYGYTAGDLPKGRIQNLQGRSEGGDAWGTRWYGGNGETTIFDVQRPHKSDDHPTMKPVKLIQAMIENSTRPGEIVIDPFLGSGSTLIAADLSGRRCFGIEYDETYADVIEARYEQHLVNRAQGLILEQAAVEATNLGPTVFEEG